MFHSIGNLYTKIPSHRQQNPFSIGLFKMLCRSYTRRTSTPYTCTQYIFKLHCTHSLCNKMHVKYSNVPLSSRNISCNFSSSHTWHKHSKFHAESVLFLEINLGHVTHFSSLGTLKVRHCLTAYDWLIRSEATNRIHLLLFFTCLTIY
jgi:hypothetical protein